MRVTARKTVKNDKIKGQFRSAIKNTLKAVKAGDSQKASEWLKKSQKALDKAAQKKVIKKNNASRQKSRLNAKVKVLVKK